MTTLVSNIIQNAFRETNLIPVGQSPTTNQQNEALDRLNALLISTIGNEVGDYFTDLTIGGTYDQSTYTNIFVPDNVRLVLNVTSSLTLNLDPDPYEGQRLSFVDVKSNIATYPVTLSGNGRLIEGATSITLNVNGDNRQWLYRADTGNWIKVTSLIISDTMPFPPEFDDYFITMLAVRLNPRYSQTLTAETEEALKRARSQIRSRYHNYKQIQSDLTTRGWLADPQGIYGYSDDVAFNKGRPYPFL